MINLEGANSFFAHGVHVYASVWAGFSEELRTAAIAQARKLLSRAIGDVLDDNEAAYAEGDTVRHEYAVYEQAFWILLNTPMPNMEQSAVAFLGADPENAGTPRKRDPNLIAPMAMRWLGLDALQFVRG